MVWMGRLANKISLAAWIGLSALGSLMGEQAFPASGGVSLQELEAAVAARDLALDEEWRALPDRAAFERKCAGFKQAFRDAIGFCSIQRTPLNATPMGTKCYGAFRIDLCRAPYRQ